MERVLRGTVTRTDTLGAYVQVPRLGMGVEFGPCQRLDTVLALAGGDQVLVTTVNGVKEDLVVLGRLT